MGVPITPRFSARFLLSAEYLAIVPHNIGFSIEFCRRAVLKGAVYVSNRSQDLLDFLSSSSASLFAFAAPATRSSTFCMRGLNSWRGASCCRKHIIQ